jgi:hypothetical protein
VPLPQIRMVRVCGDMVPASAADPPAFGPLAVRPSTMEIGPYTLGVCQTMKYVAVLILVKGFWHMDE